jgi:ribosome biogenesis protein Nip4
MTFQKFVSKFTKENVPFSRIKNSLYFVPEGVPHINDALSEGMLLGREDDDFKPSLFLLETLSKKSKNKIFINDKAEWLFLCGRDVFLESIERDDSTDDVFLVQNELDENLGYGKKVRIRGKEIVKNMLDRGDFLRRER